MTKTFYTVVGNTYPVKDRLKAECKARWDAAKKVWTVPTKFADRAQEIVAGIQTGRVTSTENVQPAWSDEQNDIFVWFANGTGNLVVQARAGTGKTTTIKQAFSHAPESRCLYAVFNAKNAREAQAKITDGRVQIRTLHSLGFMFIRRVWSDVKPEDTVEFHRVEMVAPETPSEVVTQLVKLVGFCKNLCVGVPSIETVIELIDVRSISVPDELETAYPPAKLAQIAIDVLRLSLERDERGRVSFNDMVWLPVAAGWVKPTFDLVVIDEAQDMNMPQLLMAERACTPGGRICVVGDDRQAIYGFRGAASDGMRMMRDRLNALTLGLTTTYRCPKAVVALAKSIVPDYSAAEAAPEGEVVETDLQTAIAGLNVGDAVLSRLNAPLMSIAMGLLRRNIPTRIEGRDIGKHLCVLVEKMKAKSVPDFLAKLAKWEARQVDRAMAGSGKFKESKVEAIRDQALTLSSVAEVASSVDDIKVRIFNLFQDSDNCTRPAVVCSTVHKAKGLEWNKVCLVASTFKNTTTHEEANIYYVAITRAKKTLVRGI